MIQLKFNKQRNTTKHIRRRMSDTNDFMDFISASLGRSLDEVYQRLIDCNFGLEKLELAVFTHTENLTIKKLKSAGETRELETEGENAKKSLFARIFESYSPLHSSMRWEGKLVGNASHRWS